MRAIDVHTHLDPSLGPSAETAVSALAVAVSESGISRAMVLHLSSQPWTDEEFAEATRPHRERLVPFLNVHPFERDAQDRLRRGIEDLGFAGLKLHPRLQRFSLDDKRTHSLVRAAGSLGAPVVIDAFPDGDWLMQGIQPLSYARLARECPDTRFIVAHMGGHHALDFMMLAKRLPNMHFDISYSLLYYRGSSVPTDLVYAMRSLRFERVFYGSDYPDRAIDTALRDSVAELERAGVDSAEMDRLLYSNAKEFFGWIDI